jgi:cell division protein FtsW (lipid II flippase)
MKLSQAEIAARAEERRRAAAHTIMASRKREFLLLVAGSLLVITGLLLVYVAKTNNFATFDAQVTAKDVVNLNHLQSPYALLPWLNMVGSPADQDFAASLIYEQKRAGAHFENDGALARLRVDEDQISRSRSLDQFARRVADARTRREEREAARQAALSRLARWRERLSPPRARKLSLPVLTGAEFSLLKPHVVVREPAAFRRAFWIWSVLFLLNFYALHFFWRLRGFAGDQYILPIVQVLCGLGLMLMVSLRDPLRDTLMFTDFASGVLAGCVAMALFSMVHYERVIGTLSWVPLVGAVLLAIALGLFGSGPGLSDAKVNLLHFQPMEFIRILLVLFLAGYFARHWDALRQLRQEDGRFAKWSQRFNVPRFDYLLPVVLGVAVSIVLFFWLSDLGPALVIGCLFLTLYAIARNRAALAATGLVVIVMAFVFGYFTGVPHAVRERVDMWRSPWDNATHGGDQLAGSLWSLATGGATGTGLGLGESETLPAAHTDLVLSALGEQIGLIGLLAIFALYAALIYRGLRAALKAGGAYGFFLAVGLTLIAAYQLLLISGGLLGLIPLSGVVSPFLSYGRTSMVANFALFAMILAISSRPGPPDARNPFRFPTRVLMGVLAACFCVVIGRAAWIQTMRADELLVKGTLVRQADGVRRYLYNPRLLEAARLLPKGTITDRDGLPLAASNWPVMESHRAKYKELGVTLPQSAVSGRFYPLGAEFFYLLGDTRSRLNAGATNTAFAERQSRIRLQGYDDVAETEQARDPETGAISTRVRRNYSALIPLLRHRNEPDNPQVRSLLRQPRDVRMSLHAGLQLRASAILKSHLTKLGKVKGAVVILDPATGELLASVSYPLPSASEFATLSGSGQSPLPHQDLIDRARFGLYPPGSSFKLVTAAAALNKSADLADAKFECIRLPDGRTGNLVGRRPIRDDIADRQPHGSVDMQKGIEVSCNAYFAQLGTAKVGAPALYEMANAFGIPVAVPNTAKKLQQSLAQAAYGQGQVVASPFQMARVAAAIANGGEVLQGHWIMDESNARVHAPVRVLDQALAQKLGSYMRLVVTNGTGRVLNNSPIAIAGKTGTAELQKAPSHAWFVGYAPYQAKPGKQIAFAVLVENGQYGGTAAAPIAGDIVKAARELGIL